MPSSESIIHEDQTQTVPSDQIRAMFDDTDNSHAVETVLSQSGTEYLPEVTAAFFLRSSFHGYPPPKDIPKDHPLHQRIMELDIGTIEDPIQRGVFSHIQSSMQPGSDAQQEGTNLEMRDVVASLLPGLIEKHEPETASEILGVGYSALASLLTPKRGEQLRAMYDAAGRSIENHPPTTDEESYRSLKFSLQIESQLALIVEPGYDRKILSEDQLAGLDEARKTQDQTTKKIMRSNLAMSEDAIGITRKMLASDSNLSNDLLDSEEGFARIRTCLESPAILELLTGFEGNESAQITLVKRITRRPDQAEEVLKIKEIIEQPEFTELVQALGPKAAGKYFLRRILDATDPALEYEAVRSVYALPEVKSVIADRVNPDDELGQENWSQLATLLMNDPSELKSLISAMSASPRLAKILGQPSEALPEFLVSLTASGGHIDHGLLVAAASGIISENYAQASKLHEPAQIDHYLKRVNAFVETLQDIGFNPEVLDSYKAYIAANGNMSSKQEDRASKIFKAAKTFGVSEIDPETSLDDLESALINAFVAKLVGEDRPLNEEERRRLIETMGSIGPLFTYAQQHMTSPDYKERLAELTKSVADGTYSEWHRGDGSQESLDAMIEAGYLPENLTLEQYREWITDGTSSSQEELISSAEETAQAIRDMIELATMDIDIIAPGYTIDAASLDEVVTTRNSLGRLTGMIYKAMGQAKGEKLDPTAIEAIAANLGELDDSREAQNLIGLLRNGTDPGEVADHVKTTMGHLEQLRQIIRLANISAEEVASGSLLADSDGKGKNKVQDQLFDMLSKLRKELPTELRFIPETALTLLNDHAQEHGEMEIFTAEDTIDPKVTIEIGETPQKSCQHYETGGFNSGLIGYFGPEVKILTVRNERGGIIARSITRLMQDEQGDPVIFTERVYTAVSSPQVGEMMGDHIAKKAAKMGVELRRSRLASEQPKRLTTRVLRMPAVYSDDGGGINRGSITINTS